MEGAPSEGTPAIEHLDIQEYSNHTYWRFAPYLEAVCCPLKLAHKQVTDYFRGSVPNLRHCINLIAKGSMVCKWRTSGSCAGTWKQWWLQRSWPPAETTTQAMLVLLASGS